MHAPLTEACLTVHSFGDLGRRRWLLRSLGDGGGSDGGRLVARWGTFARGAAHSHAAVYLAIQLQMLFPILALL